MNTDKKGVLSHDELNQLSILYNIRLDDVIMLEDFIKNPKIGNFILNLDLDNRGGTHFIAVINLSNKLYYFDPYGVLDNDLKDILEKVLKKPVIYNNVKFQGLKQSNCGYQCLVFLKEGENIKNDKDFNNAIQECKFYDIYFKTNKKK